MGTPTRRERARASSWEQGASAERIVGAWLDRIDGIEALHDRRVPGSRITIDHVAIGAAGVFVIDARLSGLRLPPSDARRFVRPDDQTFDVVRDREKVLAKLATRTQAVGRVLAGVPVPIAPALCLVEADGPVRARELVLDGVWVGTPDALPSLVARPGLLDRETVAALAARLARRLPAG